MLAQVFQHFARAALATLQATSWAQYNLTCAGALRIQATLPWQHCEAEDRGRKLNTHTHALLHLT